MSSTMFENVEVNLKNENEKEMKLEQREKNEKIIIRSDQLMRICFSIHA